jgi:hypothetical protein
VFTGIRTSEQATDMKYRKSQFRLLTDRADTSEKISTSEIKEQPNSNSNMDYLAEEIKKLSQLDKSNI